MERNAKISDGVVDAVTDIINIVKYIVDNPDDVKIAISRSDYTLIASLHTHPKDVGQVIGRRAHIINSIRSLISAVQGKHNITIVFEYATEREHRKSA